MMTTSTDDDAGGELVIDEVTLDALMVRIDAEGVELLGFDGVLTELTSKIMNRALEVEMADHRGYERGDRGGEGSGNNRNGHSDKDGDDRYRRDPDPGAEGPYQRVRPPADPQAPTLFGWVQRPDLQADITRQVGVCSSRNTS